VSELVVEILEDFLGKSRKHYEDKCQISFDCPVCSYDVKGLEKGDGKGNLEVNYRHHVYKCWACSETHETHGTINKLVRKYGARDHLKKYRLLIPENRILKHENNHTITGLPREFTPLDIERENFDYQKAITYLNKRNIDLNIIKKFNIGYANSGDYRGRIIFPSYDEDNEINYYLGRSYDKYSKLKYKNPEVSKMEIIFNEGKINWDSNIYLVEGVFDHMALPNSIPMLGKVLNDVLFKKLIDKAAAKVIIVLDYDAKKDAIKLYKRLNSARLRNRVLIVDMPEGFDIADVYQKLGKKGVIKLLTTARKIKESLL
jgi:DNA primase